MWYKISNLVLRFRIPLLIALVLSTVFMGYQATKVRMSFDFTNAVPTDNPKYIEYQSFREKFGGDGTTIMLGVQTDRLFTPQVFTDYINLTKALEDIPAVENVLSITNAVYLWQDSIDNKLHVDKIFPVSKIDSQEQIDSFYSHFVSLPFYKGTLYNPASNTYLMAIRVNEDILKSKARIALINEIEDIGNSFGSRHQIDTHHSGLPHIRTKMAEKTEFEIKLFLALSFILTATVLFAFFRSFTAVAFSMLVVATGVIWSLGTLGILDYSITILSGVIPPLIVVIGIPNCVYFLNKYHMEYAVSKDKKQAILAMIGKMGIVAFFTNLAAAIGFGVFFFTKSVILKEFGLVTGLNIMAIFIISLILIPIIYSYLPPPKEKHTGYLDSQWLTKTLKKITTLVFKNRKKLYISTILICVVAALGIYRLQAVGFIVDDLPKNNKIYTDLKFFEKEFKGVMPLEIVIDTRKKFGSVTNLEVWQKVDELTAYLEARPEIGTALNLVKGVKFARQGIMGGATEEYRLPNQMEFSAIRPQLIRTINKHNRQLQDNQEEGLGTLLNSFIDTSARYIRVSVNIADIGSIEMNKLLNEITPVAKEIFQEDDYDLIFTGASVTYLEGSKFIINSLKESLLLAFGMILICMIFLFKSSRIVLIATITNIVPLVITAGIMGWTNIPLKPSTVLVFSVALGITVDVTIRFLVNYKQDLINNHYDIRATVRQSIKDTGLSIIFTTLVLSAGFGVFAISDFDGTKMLGYLTAMTLVVAMVANLTLQPALLLWMDQAKRKKRIRKQKNKVTSRKV